MSTLESLTIPQLAALCGLQHDGYDAWTEPFGDTYTRRIVVPKSYSTHWNVWPHGTRGERIEAPSEHAALVALARHLNLTPKEDTVTTYKRIDRDPKTDDYVDYTPKAGDRWHFGRGEPWVVSALGVVVNVGPAKERHAHGAYNEHIRNLTTHIERPVKVRDVRGPDYAPKPGDVLCGPDGPLFVVSYVSPGGLPHVTPVGRKVPEVGLAVAHFALCTRIDREE